MKPAKRSKASLQSRLRELVTLAGVTEQQRGYELERLLLECAARERLACGPAYRGRGEQIDGFLVVDHWSLLVETKWVAEPVAASEVYAFRSKVDGKLVGTIGLFVAMGGFSPAVSDVLRFGKQICAVDGRRRCGVCIEAGARP